MPTKAQPNIWYGIHGPTPPVMQRGGEQRGAAEGEAEAGAEDPAGQDQDEEDRLDARPFRRRAGAAPALTADSTPSMASALASMPPSAISAKTTASTRTSRQPKISGGA